MNKYERLNKEHSDIKLKKRVAAYCRVSTEKDDQANSFESQQKYFRQYIERMPDWELYDIFADEGITGTNTKKRKAFNRMISCAKLGEFDMIITKEISRFARNTLDSIYYTRDLKKHGVGVLFLNDNINTLDPDAELRLTIMSSIAQEESRKTSERVKWGQKRRMEQGVVFGRDMLGYDVKDGQLLLNEYGAKIVRLIFEKFVFENKGSHTIAKELCDAGYKTVTGSTVWTNTVIYKILRNEKYCGDLVQKKTFTPDYLSHEKKRNKGEEEFIVLKNHHPPIISHEMFNEANRILDGRSASPANQSKHSNRYCFSGKIKCGQCGSTFAARFKKRKNGFVYKAWRCLKAVQEGKSHPDQSGNYIGCNCDTLNNQDAMQILYLVVNSLKTNKTIIKNLLSKIESILSVDGFSTKKGYRSIKDKPNELYTEKQDTADKHKHELLTDISAAVNEIVNGLIPDEEFYRSLLNYMVVHDKNHIDVYLNLLPYKWSYTAAQTIRPKNPRETTAETAI